MKLTILGSGTSVPHSQRSSPAYWLETESGSLLVDAGPDAPHRMAQEQLAWPDVDAIWISHFHLDHFGGLPPFLFGLRWATQTTERSKPLRIFGPKGLRTLIVTIDEANNYKLLQQRFPTEIIEVDPGSSFHILPGIESSTISTPHTIESLALRLTEASGKSIVYTADTGFSEELINFAKGVDLLLMESSFRRNKSLQKHLNLAEAIQLAAACTPRRLVLTHLYPEWDGADLVAEAKLLWTGETLEATDGLRVII